jgi:hypothetical protein
MEFTKLGLSDMKFTKLIYIWADSQVGCVRPGMQNFLVHQRYKLGPFVFVGAQPS